MNTLGVLELEYVRFLALPSSLTYLQNLRTLHLRSCYLGDISIIGDLRSLEILSSSYSIVRTEDVPAQIGRLCNLRLLDLTCCKREYNTSDSLNIEKVTISGLSHLEELHMLNNFEKWDENAIKELECLVKLKVLQIENSDLREVINKELGFPSNHRRFAISVGKKFEDCDKNCLDPNNFVVSSLSLDIPIEVLLLGQ